MPVEIDLRLLKFRLSSKSFKYSSSHQTNSHCHAITLPRIWSVNNYKIEWPWFSHSFFMIYRLFILPNDSGLNSLIFNSMATSHCSSRWKNKISGVKALYYSKSTFGLDSISFSFSSVGWHPRLSIFNLFEVYFQDISNGDEPKAVHLGDNPRA